MLRLTERIATGLEAVTLNLERWEDLPLIELAEHIARPRGEADAEIIEKYAKAITETGDLYTFLKQLDVYEQSLSSQTRLILTTDSALFRLLREIEPARNSDRPSSDPVKQTAANSDN